MLRNQRGFSMLELMIGLLIVTILIVAVVSVGSMSVKKSRNYGTMKDLNIYVNAAELYMLENVGKGLTEEGFNKYLEGSYKFEDGESFRKNPWRRPYSIFHMNDADITYPAKIHLYSVVDEIYENTPGRFHNYLDGTVYYFRGETATCQTSSPEFSKEDQEKILQDVILLFGDQIEGFVCGDYPVYNK